MTKTLQIVSDMTCNNLWYCDKIQVDIMRTGLKQLTWSPMVKKIVICAHVHNWLDGLCALYGRRGSVMGVGDMLFFQCSSSLFGVC